MYDATTNNLIIREWIDGSLFPLSANLAIIIGVFLWDSWVESRQEHTPTWWRMPGVPTACALYWVFVFDSLRSGWTWLILRFTNDVGDVPTWVRVWSNYTFVAAGLLLVIAVLRCTYLFTPPKWGNRYWIYSATITILFLLASHLYPIIQVN